MERKKVSILSLSATEKVADLLVVLAYNGELGEQVDPHVLGTCAEICV